jgi:hypothetical protein
MLPPTETQAFSSKGENPLLSRDFAAYKKGAAGGGAGRSGRGVMEGILVRDRGRRTTEGSRSSRSRVHSPVTVSDGR